MISLSCFRNPPSLTEAIQARLDVSHTTGAMNELKNGLGLQEFLENAVNFINDGNAHRAEAIAHYLMGEVDYLPTGLGAPAQEIPREVRKALLYNLLCTHRHGMFGKSELPEKTIAKLEALRLDLWLATSPPDKRTARASAVEAVRAMHGNNSKVLSLRELDLDELPPLPADLESLILSGCNIPKLKLPPKMDLLKELRICNTRGLRSLNGLSSKLPALSVLQIDSND